MRKGLVVVALLAGLVSAADAPAQVRAGANLAWADDADFGIGGRIGFGLGSISERHPVEAFVSFDYFFPDEGGSGVDLTYWEINANGIWKFSLPNSSVAPYLGAGVNFARASVDLSGIGSGSDSDVGLNILGGLRFNVMGGVQPFTEVRLELGGGEQLVLAAGLLFGKP